jgi:tetratricopeptide (TPR) repeat protein
MEQLFLFDDEFVLRNQAAAALLALQPGEALEQLEKCRALYPGSLDLEKKIAIAAFLKKGLAVLPPDPAAHPSYLFGAWKSFLEFCRSLGPDGTAAEDFRIPFFRRIAAALENAGGLTDGGFLAAGLPAGYAYLQAGEYDRAIRSLQSALTQTPDNAAIYGYLGDAYLLRGEPEAARHLYFEACLIDPAALDWTHLRDNELKALRERIPDEYGFDSTLACEWLPACAYVRGLFTPKRIRLREEFKAFTEDYLALKKLALRSPSPLLAAKLFFRGIVLCDNEPFLKMFKGIDFADVRREMKAAHAGIFTEYLMRIDRRRG